MDKWLWIALVIWILAVGRVLCAGRISSQGSSHQSHSQTRSNDDMSVTEAPEERRRKIEQTLITRKVLSRSVATTSEYDWWKTFRTMGARPIRFSEHASPSAPNLVEEETTEKEGGHAFLDLEEGRIGEQECREEPRSCVDVTQSDLQTNTVLRTISTCATSLKGPGQLTGCDICLREYNVGEEVSWSPNEECTHAFHKACITDWLMTHSSCPCCRRNYLAEIAVA